MQSSTDKNYLPDEFNDTFFYNDGSENKHLFLHSHPTINDQQQQQEEEDDDDDDDEDENYLRGTINGKKNETTTD